MKPRNLIAKAFIISGIYLFFGCLWIFLSDAWVFSLFEGEPDELYDWQLAKGLAYVAASTLLIFLLSISLYRRMARQSTQVDQLFNQERLALLVADVNGQIIDASSNIHKLLEYSREELIGKTIKSITPPEFEEIDKHWVEAIEKGRLDEYKVEKAYITKSGKQVHVSLRGTVQRDATGKVTTYITTVENTEEQHRIRAQRERESKEKELIRERMEQVFESIPVLITLHEERSGVLSVNRAFTEVLGYTKEMVQHIDFMQACYPNPEIRQEAYEFMQKSNAGWREFQVRTIDGEIRIQEWSNIQLNDGTMMGIGIDRTALALAEKALQISTEQLEIAISGGKLGVWSLDLQTNHLVVDENWCQMAAYPIELAPTSMDGLRGLIHPDDLDAFNQHFAKAINTPGGELEHDLRIKRMNGDWKWASIRGKVKHKPGNLGSDRASGVFIDIDTLKQAQEALRKQNDFIKKTLDNLPLGIAVNQIDTGDSTLINPQFSEVYGWPQEELSDVEAFFKKVYPDKDYREQIQKKVMEDMASGDPERMQWRNVHITTQSGEKRVINAKNIPVIEQNLMISTVDDVTLQYHAERIVLESKQELEKLNAELMRSNKELEEFAYVASHDLQEPLRMVAQFTQMLERKYRDAIDQEAERYIQYAVEGAKRMQVMINDLLQYSRVTAVEEEFRTISANDLLSRACQMLSIKIDNSKAEIESQDLPEVHVIPSLIERLLINLLDNSLKYAAADRNPNIRIAAEDRVDRYEFSITDNGLGIEPTFADKIFVIFHRLHKRDEYYGTGIGLAVCKRIVEKHGGRIWLDTEYSEQGTCMRFTIPKQLH